MFSEKITANLQRSSWIRAMFEQGIKLSQKYGAENVYDFSLGNPYAEPPKEVIDSLQKHILGSEKGLHRYMNNAGYPAVREKLAKSLSLESGVKLDINNIVMTVGAAGGLNVVLKSILNPNEEVMVFAPYFVEYNSYIDNHGGKSVVIPANTDTFEPNIEEFKKQINKNTKAIILNTPNNPTGVVYKEETMIKMNNILEQKEKEFGTEIYVISDQPYSAIVYDGVKVPSLLKLFKNAIVVNSFSKSLGLAGERIGYIAISSRINDYELLFNALSYCNRTLGFVNAPGLFQKVIEDAMDAKVDIAAYKKRRDLLYNKLTEIGFEIVKPEGAFYLFPKALIEDDVEFVKKAVDFNILLVPGTGFGCPGYFRMSYCVELDMIERSLPKFEELMKAYKK